MIKFDKEKTKKNKIIKQIKILSQIKNNTKNRDQYNR
jgi:hypothetical protein